MAYIRGKPEIRSHPRDISLRHQRTSAIFHRRTWGVGRSKTPLTQIPQNSPCPLPYHGHMAISHIAPLLIYLPTINAQNGGFSTLTPVKWSNIVEILQFERFCWYSDCHTCMVSTSIYYVFEASMIFFFSLCPYVLWFLLHLAGHFVHLCFSKSAPVLRWCVVKLWCHDNLRWPCFLLGCCDLWKDVASKAFRKFFTGVASRACWNIHAKVRA